MVKISAGVPDGVYPIPAGVSHSKTRWARAGCPGVSRGFTLIEILIVVVIIGVLAAAAIPSFLRTTVRAKQAEARQLLKQIFLLEHAYRQGKDTYIAYPPTPAGGTLTEIGMEIWPTARYTYSVVAGAKGIASSFIATATVPAPGLDDDPVPDIWQIDDSGVLQPVSNDAEQ